MRLRLPPVILLFLLVSGSLQAQDRRIPVLKQYLRAAAGLGQLNGSVLIAEKGKLLIDTAYGFANMELGVRNSANTRFRVASVTKQFTAMAIMILAESGRLNVADPINKYLDSLPPEWNQITIHQVLRHVSGISDYEGWFDGYTTQAYSDYMAQENAPARIARDARKKPLDFPPGTKFSYSNSGYILLGYIVEQASGMSYEQFVRTRILEPLGMTRSAMDHSEEILADRASGYRIRQGSFPRAWFNGMTRGDYQNAYYQLMSPPQADAGLVTTARDLYRWDQALYTEQLVTRTTLDSIFKPGLGNYGYGWFVAEGPDGVTDEHSGGLPGFSCYIMRIPDSHRTIIVLGNVERLGRTVRDLATIMRGKPIAVPRARHLIEADSAHSASFGGVYHAESGDSLSIEMDQDILVVHWLEHFRSALLPEGPQDYYVAQLGGVARFRESGGRMQLTIEDGFGAVVVRALR